MVLRDGALGVIRELVAEDRDALLELHESLSPRTLYLRFFSASKLSASRYVTRLVRPGTGDHGAVVLQVQGRLIGVAAYECIEEDLDPGRRPKGSRRSPFWSLTTSTAAGSARC